MRGNPILFVTGLTRMKPYKRAIITLLCFYMYSCGSRHFRWQCTRNNLSRLTSGPKFLNIAQLVFSVNSTCHFVEVSVHRFRKEIKDEKNHLKIFKQVFLRLTMTHNSIYESLSDDRIHKYGRGELQSKELLFDRNCRYMLNRMAFSRRKKLE